MIISLIIIQIAILCVFVYCLLTERKHCKHLDWWSDIGACLIIIPCLIPMFGIMLSLAGIIDSVKNLSNYIVMINKRRKLL